jgi:vacuolar-type H+-ATPase subunit I/STV1
MIHLMSPLDVGLGVFAVLGLLVPPVLLPPLVLGEAVVLRRILPGARGLRDALVMNLVSTLIGMYPSLIGSGLLPVPRFIVRNRSLSTTVHIAVIVMISWGLSVLIEGIILQRLEKQFPSRELWTASLVCNVVSYVGLLAAVLLGAAIAAVLNTVQGR